ncbi:MAG: energy transducer TonB, partial [Gammaproteobacteria bacterium]|nr:energy transducer TonB [Gammaproteobacteria bacterium]
SAGLDDSLSDAFGDDATSFTQTMTGIVKSVGTSLQTGKRDRAAAESSKPVSSGSGGSLSTKLKFFGIGAAVLIVAGLGVWLFGGLDETALPTGTTAESPALTEAEPAPATQTPPSGPTPTPVAPDARAAGLLEEARLAATAGQIFNPPGGNAIELYMAAAEAAPGNAEVTTELGAVIDQALSMAESSLLEKRADDAAAALQRVSLADPDNARLPFLNAQLAQVQLRDLLDDARSAIRESRFEDAAAALGSARTLAVSDTAEIDVVADELDRALNEQQIDDVLAKANTRLDEGQLIAPTNDNARYYYELALRSDPDNAAARQGLVAVASKLVLQARAQIDIGDFSAADVLLIDAHKLDPSSEELADAAAALGAARERVDQERRAAAQQKANREAAAERAAAEKVAAEKAAAERAAAEQAAAEQAAAEQAAAEQVAAERAAALGTAGETLAAESPAAEQAPGNAAASAGDELTRTNIVSPDPTATGPVAASSLNRTKYIAPKYPRAAQRRNLSGYVDVIFTVDIDGTVKDVTVAGSEPGETFVNAATAAVEDWEFEPVIEGGVAVEKRAAVRMMFAIE